MAKRTWTLNYGNTELVSAVVDPAHERIGCLSCGSVWLGDLAQAQEELCPYCECDDGIVPVELPQGLRGTEEAKMDLSEALEHLGNLVDIAAPEDTHYPRALKTVSDAVEPKCPLPTKPEVAITVWNGIVEIDECPACVRVTLEYIED